jgi:ubiquinone/menaquinone biosynthesis C-methylase UbiE
MSSQTRERADELYPEFGIGSPYRENLFNRYDECIELVRNKIVLDIPTGTGWGFSRVASYSRVPIGIDIVEDVVNRHTYHNINFLVGNMTNIPLLDNSIDVILCLEGYEHINKTDQHCFILEVHRVLKNLGILCVTSPYTDYWNRGSGNEFHLCEPSLIEFIAEVDGIFRITNLSAKDYWIRCELVKC